MKLCIFSKHSTTAAALLFFCLVLCNLPSGFSSSRAIQEWPTLHIGRALMQDSTNSTNVTETFLILAENRTQRRDPLDNFNIYKGGWDVKNEHYWASVGFTAIGGFILAALWLLIGVACVLLLCCCCCCCRDKLRGSHKGGVCIPLLFLLIFTIAAIAGCVLVYVYQGKAHDELSTTLDYVVQQSDIVVVRLRNTSTYLGNAQSLDAVNFVLSQSQVNKMKVLDTELTAAASTLESKTHDNAKSIMDVLNKVRLAMIIVAGVMLLLVLIGFVFSTLGMTPLMYLLVIIVWFAIAAVWIMCGIYVMLNNVVGDTCVAMGEWVANPSAHTNLEDILPCVDINTTDAAYDQTKVTVNDAVTGINNGIKTYLNSGNNSTTNASASVPLMCNPIQPSISPAGCVNVSQAAQDWLPFVCNSTANNQSCPLDGKFTTQIYDQLNRSANTLDGLNDNIPFLLDLANCRFVRNAFTTIRDQHCHHLREYIKLQYIGLALIAGGFMISIIFWIMFNRKRKHVFFHHKD